MRSFPNVFICFWWKLRQLLKILTQGFATLHLVWKWGEGQSCRSPHLIFAGKLLSDVATLRKQSLENRRGCYISVRFYSAWDPGTCAFVLLFPLLDAVRNNGWLSVVWVTCSVSQGWARWPCAGKRRAFEQEGHTGNRRCIVASSLKPRLLSVGSFTVKFHSYTRFLACRALFYCFFSYTQWLLVLRLLYIFRLLCVCPAPTPN